MIDLKQHLQQIKIRGLTIYFIARDPRCGLVVRVLALIIAAYAFSPIDLIPDFIPVLGLLDDLLLVFVFYVLIIRLTPIEIRQTAESQALIAELPPASMIGASIVVILWLLILAMFL